MVDVNLLQLHYVCTDILRMHLYDATFNMAYNQLCF